MNKVFKPYLWKFILVFFDDIIVYNPNIFSHVLHLDIVFDLFFFSLRRKRDFIHKSHAKTTTQGHRDKPSLLCKKLQKTLPLKVDHGSRIITKSSILDTPIRGRELFDLLKVHSLKVNLSVSLPRKGSNTLDIGWHQNGWMRMQRKLRQWCNGRFQSISSSFEDSLS